MSVLFHFCFQCLVHFVVSFRAFVCIFFGFVWIIQIMNLGLSCFSLFHHRISFIFQYLYFTSMTFKSDYSNDLPLLVQCVILFSIPSTMLVFIVVVVSVPRIDAFSTLSSIKFIYLITYVIHS